MSHGGSPFRELFGQIAQRGRHANKLNLHDNRPK